ncbi:hypothetical protein [Flavobacterium sp.]|uniref:hypothetical protein n=1 Tax=Flavobacterium sp. TaxID=239 RepID=UPI00286EA267|nr:hypothetical protein [Flavobacterium sp.]
MYLLSPIKDPDYTIKGKVFCLIDTDTEKVEVPYELNKNLFFERLLNKDEGTVLIDVNSNLMNPPTEIEDCLDPIMYYQTLMEFSEEDNKIKTILQNNSLIETAKNSSEFLDLKTSEKKSIKEFFDGNEGFNKVRFAKKYTEISKQNFYSDVESLNWINNIKKRIK